jgi:hypothetical protein
MDMELLIGAGVVGCVLVVLNTVFISVIFFTQRKINAVNQWPATTGTVVTSMLESRSSEDGYTNYPVVVYTYQLMGQTYQSRTIAPGMEVGGTGAGQVISRYPLGSQVQVFYNPQNPSDAVLEKKAPAQFLMWFLLILFDVVLCCVVPASYLVFTITVP